MFPFFESEAEADDRYLAEMGVEFWKKSRRLLRISSFGFILFGVVPLTFGILFFGEWMPLAIAGILGLTLVTWTIWSFAALIWSRWLGNHRIIFGAVCICMPLLLIWNIYWILGLVLFMAVHVLMIEVKFRRAMLRRRSAPGSYPRFD